MNYEAVVRVAVECAGITVVVVMLLVSLL